MAYIHSIAKLFEIKDPNIVLEDKVDTLLVKEVTCKVIFGTLSYQPAACQNCGVVNRSSDDLIKFGYKTSRIKLTTLGLQPVLLMLKKQRFQCKHCQTTFMATTPLVDERCFISNTLKQMITLELAEIQAITLIAKRLNISPTPVSTQLKKAVKALNPSKHTLPEHIGIDEFRSVRNQMSAIIMDVHNHRLVDIIPERVQTELRDYFMRYPREARLAVKTVTIDMYKPYYQFFQRLFPNAEIIIDRFHIIQLLNRALNQSRIQLMNRIRYTRPTDYTKLKRLWKVLLKHREELDFEHYHSHRLFEGLVTQKSMVEYLLSIDPKFRTEYELINDLKTDIIMTNVTLFEEDLYKTRQYTVSRHVRTAFTTLFHYREAIENSLTYTLSNGVVEGMNNKIKTIKRSGFGYRNFEHLRARVFLSQKLLARSNKPIRPLYFSDEVTAA